MIVEKNITQERTDQLWWQHFRGEIADLQFLDLGEGLSASYRRLVYPVHPEKRTD